MEIRFLQDEEIANAAGLSRFVYDNCLRVRSDASQTVAFVEEYLSEANLKKKTAEGSLLLWGAFENDRLLATGGMQTDGLITMLYVLPQCFKRKIGTSLLETMRIYARDVLGLSRVMVNANPAFTSFYFAKQGFSQISPMPNPNAPFVSMYALSDNIQFYKNRKVPMGVIIAAVIGCVVFATILGCGFMAWYLFG